MKVLALVGNPRKGSNTDLLVDQFFRGVRKGIIQVKNFTCTILKFSLALIAVHVKRKTLYVP